LGSPEFNAWRIDAGLALGRVAGNDSLAAGTVGHGATDALGSPLPRPSRPFIAPILKAAQGRHDPFAEPPVSGRYLRISLKKSALD
jgi:hypothetical protein